MNSIRFINNNLYGFYFHNLLKNDYVHIQNITIF